MSKVYEIEDLFKTRWEECTPREMIALIDISGQLEKFAPETKEYGILLINALKILRKNKKVVTKIASGDSEEAIAVLVDCFNDIKFFKRKPDGSFHTPWLFFPVGNFGSDGALFERPEMISGLPMYDRIFDQLVFADAAYSAFGVLINEQKSVVESGDKKALKDLLRDLEEVINNLIAVLYTPGESFQAHRAEVRARYVPLHLDMGQRMIIIHTYANIRSFIMARCPNLFPKSLETKDASERPPQLTGEMWLDLRFALAETEVFKGFETARNANIYDALDLLDKKSKENAKANVG